MHPHRVPTHTHTHTHCISARSYEDTRRTLCIRKWCLKLQVSFRKRALIICKRALYICKKNRMHPHVRSHIIRTGWRRFIGCLKLQVSFRKRATTHRALLRKITCEDKASYRCNPVWRSYITHMKESCHTARVRVLQITVRMSHVTHGWRRAFVGLFCGCIELICGCVGLFLHICKALVRIFGASLILCFSHAYV